jgi:hypothetical protein
MPPPFPGHAVPRYKPPQSEFGSEVAGVLLDVGLLALMGVFCLLVVAYALFLRMDVTS